MFFCLEKTHSSSLTTQSSKLYILPIEGEMPKGAEGVYSFAIISAGLTFITLHR